jgi:DNA polymerase II small subunit/DNA polymerase delta subunit B
MRDRPCGDILITCTAEPVTENVQRINSVTVQEVSDAGRQILINE